ncbi:ribonucleoside-diphosphate reductase class II [Dongia mobilis]|uniref:Vitamin B12-dependent ribonucleotide reductase n=1 Tax=Dongia mobilis TaxID=578943 RepID=A0A4R6WPL6_9PROT|nr:adenosylcobalamin-dependent ribonucleoside-diphosphate reductase [Dongia mobilis]TDQ81061.1 ribonucleoside-diphosphate reductase class II [Dongia mobilis]
MAQVAAISQQIWDMKYRLKALDGAPVDKTIEDSWRRVADALAAAEAPENRARWAEEFYQALADFKFLPAGRILAGAGAKRNVTLFNCFVMGTIPDDMGGIFTHLKEAALTMQQGGGIGYDFSTLRPKGAPVKGVGADASGPLSFMDVWDAMCRTIMSAGHRRGAMMATLRCDHPDVEAFIEAKRTPGRLRMFNLSVLVTDAFMAAVKADEPWELKFGGTTYKVVQARELWDRIMRATYAYAEPGVIFIDRINKKNNLHYCETISATNPCGEQPLPPYGACLLGSINLTTLISDPFTAAAKLDLAALEQLVRVAVRMMDNTIDVSNFPLDAQAAEAQAKRRIGLGVTGLADALIMCEARYGGPKAIRLTEEWLAAIARAAYLASTELAAEKGAFPLYDREKFLASETVQTMDAEVQAAIAAHGIRNALLTSIAPTGTISLFADNVSSGLEPVFSFKYTRHVLMPDGTRQAEEVSDYAYRLFRRLHGENAALPDYFVDAQSLSPHDHVVMQASVQKYIDSSISKTINCPVDLSFEDFKSVYLEAYELGCKGCTTYRPNDVTGSVLEAKPKDAPKTQQPELPLVVAPRGGQAVVPQSAAAPIDAPKPQDVYEAGGVVYMTQPLDRPEALPGATYKVRWPESDHAIYITINDVIQDGRRRPFEVFINSKNMEHYAWTVGLTRMISAVFRRGGDISFVVEELKAVFDPRGGSWVGGRYVPSLLAAIGEVIEKHLIAIGFMPDPAQERSEIEHMVARKVANLADGQGNGDAGGRRLPHCPKCNSPSLIRQEGCDLCTSCGYSKCG